MHAFFNLTEAKEPLESSEVHFLSPNLNLTCFNVRYPEKRELYWVFI